MTNTALFAAAAACAFFATEAKAAPAKEPPAMVKVSYADLDLSSKPGRGSLRGRIRWAAERVCTDYDRASPGGPLVISRCFRAAMQDALQQAERAIAEQAAGRRLAETAIPVHHH